MNISSASDEAKLLLDMVIKKYHPRLAKAGVTVGVEFAHKKADSKEPTALSLHGYYAQAIASITPYRQRARGAADCYITIDNGSWNGKDKKARVALLDHELTHFELDLDKDKNLRSDDLGRPKLKTRPHDWQIGGFDEVVARHGVDVAPESVVLRKYVGASKQLTLVFDAGELPFDGSEFAVPDAAELAEAPAA